MPQGRGADAPIGVLFKQGRPGSRPLGRRLIGAAAIGGTAALAAPSLAAADDFQVTNLNDSGAGSLRQAITDANAHPNVGGVNDRITFTSGLSGDIALGSALPDVTKGVDIVGPGQALVVDGVNMYRPLYVSTADSVSISDLTLTQGYAPLSGGAIYAKDSGHLTLDGVTISDNKVHDGGGQGGGVAAVNTPLTVTDSTLTGNVGSGNGTYGAAIYGGHTSVEISGSTISANHDTANAADGGGVAVRYGTLTLTDSTLDDNHAENHGGSILGYESTVTVTGSTISGSSTTRTSGNGGGISDYCIAGAPTPTCGPLTITGSTISGNSVTNRGGGLWVAYTTAIIRDSTFSGNSTSQALGNTRAAGVCIQEADLQMSGTTISGNTARGTPTKGAGMYISGDDYDQTMEIDNSTISGNTILNTSAGSDGAGLFVEKDSGHGSMSVTINSSTITGNANQASGDSDGGGIVVVDYDPMDASGPNLSLINTIVAGNSATRYGADLYSTYSSSTNAPSAPFALDHSLIGEIETAPTPAKFIPTIIDNGGNITGTPASPVDPKLGALANNVGPTKTHALLSGSPAIDAGATALSVDQRGVGRPQNGADDIGAYEVDANPPTTITSAPPSRTANAMPAIAFSSPDPDVDHFECSLDSAAFATCASPFTTPKLADGAHTVLVRAVDKTGHTGAAASASFSVDASGPTTRIDASPPGTTSDTTPSVSFSSPDSDLASFECSLDGGAFAACTSPHTTPELADGAHTVAVRAIDDLGNVGAAANAAFTVDTGVTNPFVAFGQTIRVRGREFKAKVRAGAGEDVTAVVNATLLIKQKPRGRAATKVRHIKLRAVTRDLAAGSRAALPLRFKGNRRRRWGLTNVLEDALASGKSIAQLKVRVKLTDGSGNSVVERGTAKLTTGRG